ncbi:MAG: LysM peptidoglycan-binding domain-containing protein [Ardenticatenaceae bacterium]|nr:LysM peptidoglycan-binding domain-containing protein [Ardenticatenaceae bacterium]
MLSNHRWTIFCFVFLIFCAGCQPDIEFESAAADLFEPGSSDPIVVTEVVGNINTGADVEATLTMAAILPDEIEVRPTMTPYPPPPYTPDPNQSPTPFPTYTPYVTVTPNPYPPTATPMPPPPPPPEANRFLPNGCAVWYEWEIITTQPDDTLFSLADRYQTTPYELQRGNCIGDAQQITAGQQVAVPPTDVPITYGPAPTLNVYPSEQCFDEQFPPSSGLAIGRAGAAVTYVQGQHVELWADATAFIPNFGLLGGETFDVLEGPVCFSYSSGGGSADQVRRRWRVRTSISGVEGWIDEVIGDFAQYLYVATADGSQPEPAIDYFTVKPENPSLQETITIEWAARNTSGVKLTGGGIDMPPLSPQWVHTIPAVDLILDGNSCTTFVVTAIGGNQSTSAEQPLCINLAPSLVISQFDVSPQPLTGPGPVQALVSWTIDGFDPAVHRAGFVWYEGGYLAGIEEVTQGQGSFPVEVNVDLPGTMLFRLEVTDGKHTLYKEAFVATAVSCETPRMTNDPTLPTDCPSTPIVLSTARYQPFEGGTIFWREVGGDERPLVILYNDGTAYAPPLDLWQNQGIQPGETPPEGMFVPEGEFGYVWQTMPGVRDKLGWALGTEVNYQTEWQEIAGHVVFNLMEGMQWRYLIYDGDYGMWVPIASQHIP